jgi:hypothetical protein
MKDDWLSLAWKVLGVVFLVIGLVVRAQQRNVEPVAVPGG